MWFAGHWPAWEVPLTSWPRKPAMPWPTSVGARMMPRARTMTTVIFSSNRLRASVRRRSRRTTMTARSTATLIVSKASSPPSDLSGAAGDSPRVSCVAGGQRCCDQIVRDWRQCAAMAGFGGADVRETRVRQGPGAAAGHLRLHRPDGPPFRGRKWADETHFRPSRRCRPVQSWHPSAVPDSGWSSASPSPAAVPGPGVHRGHQGPHLRGSPTGLGGGRRSGRGADVPGFGTPRLCACWSATGRRGSSWANRVRRVLAGWWRLCPLRRGRGEPFASAGGFSGMPRMAPAVVRWIRAGHASAERSRRRTRVTATPDVSAMSAADPTAHVVGPPEHAAGHEWLRSTAKGRHLPRRPALALRQPVVLRFVGREAPAGLGRGPLGAVPAQGVRGRRQPLRPGPGPPSSGSSGPSSRPGRPAGSDRSHGRPARTGFQMMPFGTWRRSRPGRPVRGGADSGSITCQA